MNLGERTEAQCRCVSVYLAVSVDKIHSTADRTKQISLYDSGVPKYGERNIIQRGW